VCMVLSITPTSTFAEISPQVDEGNVCTHHLHDEKCGYTQALAQVDCDKNCTDTNDDGVIDHTADCAYSPAIAANPCNFDVASCEICHPKNGETADAGIALPSEPPVLAKTDAPTTAMATVAKETAIQPSVSFVLDNETAYADTATWAVYDSETATTAREDIVASCNANTLTLAHKTDLPVAVYYVAVTESGKAESARLALTVAESVAPVALLGAAANAGEIKLTTDVKTLENGTTYTVSNRTELENLATLVNSAETPVTGYTVKMLNNIDLSGRDWTPIGTCENIMVNKPFAGTFDGNGFEVQNLTINNTSTDNQGLFGYVVSDGVGVVKNVGVTGNVSGNDYIGGVVGWNEGGTVQNCYSTVNVRGNVSVGGVVGNNYGTVQNCYSTGTASGTENVGGVVGGSHHIVQNCYSTGTVSGSTKVGGVVGYNSKQVANCVSLGASVLRTDGSKATNFGRVVGLNDGGTLANNKARGDMLVNNAIVTGGAANNINGENVAVSDSTTQDSVFASTAFNDTNGWNGIRGNLVAGASLPTLKGFKNAQTP
ncbi:MAG: GLUG motif-containing protein, partial [Oscillospiraceae bacterium]